MAQSCYHFPANPVRQSFLNLNQVDAPTTVDDLAGEIVNVGR